MGTRLHFIGLLFIITMSFNTISLCTGLFDVETFSGPSSPNFKLVDGMEAGDWGCLIQSASTLTTFYGATYNSFFQLDLTTNEVSKMLSWSSNHQFGGNCQLVFMDDGGLVLNVEGGLAKVNLGTKTYEMLVNTSSRRTSLAHSTTLTPAPTPPPAPSPPTLEPAAEHLFTSTSSAVFYVVDGSTTLLAGNEILSGSTDGDPTFARFSGIVSAAIIEYTLYIADQGNYKIRTVSLANGYVATLAGSGVSENQDGTGTGAGFSLLYSIAATGSGELFVVDNAPRMIRKVTTSGEVISLTPSSYNVSVGSFSQTRIGAEAHLFSGQGNSLFIVANHRLLQISDVTSSDPQSTLTFPTPFGSKDGTASEATYHDVIDMCIRSDGVVVLLEYMVHAIRVVATDGSVTTVATANSYRLHSCAVGILHDGSEVTFVFANHKLFYLTKDGGFVHYTLNGAYSNSIGATAGESSLGHSDIFYSTSHGLFAFDNSVYKLFKVSSILDHVAGSGSPGATDGTGTGAGFAEVRAAVCVDSTNTVYFIDDNWRKMTIPAYDVVTLIAAKEKPFAYDGAPPSLVAFAADVEMLYVATPTYVSRVSISDPALGTKIAGGALGFVDGDALYTTNHAALGATPNGDVYVFDGYAANLQRLTSQPTQTPTATLARVPTASRSQTVPHSQTVSASTSKAASVSGSISTSPSGSHTLSQTTSPTSSRTLQKTHTLSLSQATSTSTPSLSTSPNCQGLATIDAGPHQVSSVPTSVMDAVLPAVGHGKWTITSGTATITAAVDPKTAVNGSGLVEFMWSVTIDGCGSNSSSVRIKFPSCDAATTCSGNGECDFSTDTCTCHNSESLGHFSGSSCSVCAAGFDMATGCKIPMCVDGAFTCVHGACSDGTCVCRHNVTHGHWGGTFCDRCVATKTLGFWTGSDCNTCQAGYYPQPRDASVPSACSVFCDSTVTCGDRGVCTNLGDCACFNDDRLGHWDGANCSNCAAPYFGSSCNISCAPATTCSGNGYCNQENACVCNGSPETGYWTSSSIIPGEPKCDVCASGFRGEACKEREVTCSSATCIHGNCTSSGLCQCSNIASEGHWSGAACNQCAFDPVNGFWAGDMCDTCAAGYWGLSCLLECPRNCSGHGHCSLATAGKCDCINNFEEGFWGGDEYCSICSSGFSGSKCLSTCQQGSSCSNGVCLADGTCKCFANATHGFFGGATCSVCLSDGTSSFSGATCTQCTDGFSGAKCDVFCDDFATCTGNGECSPSGTCTCFTNSTHGFWTGPRCDECQTGKLYPDCRQELPRKDFNGCKHQFYIGIDNATFDTTFTELHVFTNASSDRGVSSFNPHECATYLIPSTLELLGGGAASCTWPTDQLLVIRLASSATVSPADSISFRASSIVAVDPGSRGTACGHGIDAVSMHVALPKNAPPPTAMLLAPINIGGCEGVTLDGTMSRASSPKTKYTFSAVSPEVSGDFSDLLRHNESPRVAIPSDYLGPGTWRFKLDVEDEFTGLKSTAFATITKLDTTPPRIIYEGSSKVVFAAAEGTELVVNAAFTPCLAAEGNSRLAFKWTIIPTPEGSLDGTRSSLVIPAGVLRPSTEYTATLNVSQIDGIVVRASTTRTIHLSPQPSPIRGAFTGMGNVVSRLGPLRSAYICVDPDNTTRIQETNWRCSGPACSDMLSAVLATTQTPRLDIPASQWATNSTAQELVLIATCRIGTKQKTDTISFAVQSSTVPHIELISPSTVSLAAGDTLRLSSVVTGATSPRLRWSCVLPCQLNLSDTTVSPLGDQSNNLVVQPHALSGGTTYVFTFTAVDEAQISNPETATASAQTIAMALRGPSGGTLVSDTTKLSSLEDVTLEAVHWVTDPQAYPLSFAFYYYAESGVRTQLSSFSPNPTSSLTVTRIQSASVYSFELVVRDRLGSEATALLHLLAVSRDDRGATAAVSQKARLALRQGRSNEALTSLVSLASATTASTSQDDVELLLTSVLPNKETAHQLASVGALVATGISKKATSTDSSFSYSSLEQLLDLSSNCSSLIRDTSRHASGIALSSLTTVGTVARLLDQSSGSGSARQGLITEDEQLHLGLQVTQQAGLVARGLSSTTVPGEHTAVLTQAIQVGCSRHERDAVRNVPNGVEGSSFVLRKALHQITSNSPVDLCAIQYSSNVFPSAQVLSTTDDGTLSPNADPLTLVTPLVSFEVSQGDTALTVSNSEILLQLPRRPHQTSETQNATLECMWYNRAENAYSSAGCSLVPSQTTDTLVTCNCSHLTEFAVRINKVDVGNFEDAKVAGIAAMSFVGCAFVGLVVYSFIMDQHRQRRYILHKHAFAEQRKTASTLDETLSALDLRADKLTTRRRMKITPQKLRGWSLYFHNLGQNHPWLSPFFGHPASNLTAPQRVCCLFVSILVSLFANGLTFQGSEDERLGPGQFALQTFFAVCISAPMSFVVVTTVKFLFVRTPRTPCDQQHTYEPSQEDVERWAEMLKTTPDPFEDMTGNAHLKRGLGASTNAKDAEDENDDDMLNFTNEISAAFGETARNFEETLRTSRMNRRYPTIDIDESEHESSGTTRIASRQKVLSEIKCTLDEVSGHPVQLEPDEIIQTAISLDMRRRHIAGISVQAYILAQTVRDDKEVLTATIRPLEFVRQLGILLCVPVVEQSSESQLHSPHTAYAPGQHFAEDNGNLMFTGIGEGSPASPIPPTGTVSHHTPAGALVISSTLQNYLGNETIAVGCMMPRTGSRKHTMMQLYSQEMHGTTWRMAIEMVRAKQLILAEVLFTMHLLLENPDLYFIFFDTPKPQQLEDLLAVVLSVCGVHEQFGLEAQGPNVGRMWATFYSTYFFQFDDVSYKRVHQQESDMPSVKTIIALLDLRPGKPIIEYGCVSYSLHVEEENFYEPLETALQNTAKGSNNSLVQAAHIFRLATKPNLDQRWEVDNASRMEMAISTGHAPHQDIQDAIEESNRAVCGKTFDGAQFVIPNGTATIPDVLQTIQSVKKFERHRTRRNAFLELRYAPGTIDKVVHVPLFFLALLPTKLKNIIQSANSCHNNFYATIEFGRLMAMTSAIENGTLTMADFGNRYVQELTALDDFSKQKGLYYVGGFAQWRSISPGVTRNHDVEIAGNNIFPPTFVDGSDPVLSGAVTTAASHEDGARLRFAMPDICLTKPLTILAKYHPTQCMGTGSSECPHIGIASAVTAAYYGDRVELLPGRYAPAPITNCQGTLANELLVAPRGYFALLENQGDLEAFNKRRLTAEEQRGVAGVQLGTEDAYHSKQPLIHFSDSTHVRLAGVDLNCAAVAAISDNSPECRVVHSTVHCMAPFTTDSTAVVSETNNTVTATSIGLRRVIKSKMMPWPILALAWIIGIGLLLTFIFMVLFLTASFTDTKATEWIIRSAVTMAVIGLIVNPIAIAAISRFTLLNNIVMAL